MTFTEVTLQLLEGFKTTCALFFLTLAFAVPLGLIVAFFSMSKLRLIRYLTRVFVWIIRGTPLMLQVIIVFYCPGLMFGIKSFPRFEAVAIAFIINYSVYFSEIYRGGIQSIPRGQYEAGQVLGMKKSQVFFRVVLLQVIKRILPPMSNEVITLVKDTSLARVISVMELVKAAEVLVATKGLLWPLFYIGVFYLIFCGGLTVLFSKLEKKLDYFRG